MRKNKAASHRLSLGKTSLERRHDVPHPAVHGLHLVVVVPQFGLLEAALAVVCPPDLAGICLGEQSEVDEEWLARVTGSDDINRFPSIYLRIILQLFSSYFLELMFTFFLGL